ncbi:hypothetical protein Ahy_A05g023978 [Arachis hypogaea]|uniref:Uncharacterized protein n=1 Tax=Arachis hypogaea TaxID=3818 RepID=A0A445D530_ARAHY|nr:hypothetical protein Ahy_A05g023978 [Arachis hypogaea]
MGMISQEHSKLDSDTIAEAMMPLVAYLQKLVVNIGYSKMVEEYNINYKRLQERMPIGTTTSNYLRHRRGHMTTNLVLCINSLLKGGRNLLVLALVRATYYWLNELFTQKNTEAY